MPNRVALVIHYIARMKAGLVTVPLNYRYTTPEIDRALTVGQASMLIAHAERKQDLRESRQARELPRGPVDDEPGNGRHASFQELTDTTPAKNELPDPGRAIRRSSPSPRAVRVPPKA